MMLRRAGGFARSLSTDVSSLQGRSLDTLFSLSAQEMRALLDVSHGLKARLSGKSVRYDYQPLEGRSMAMIFQKRSTRTRVSTETGFSMLGGHALFLGSEDIQLGVNESVRDTARVLSRYNDVILARVHSHDLIDELIKHSTVPVINALSDMYHPLQGLADIMTLEEHWGGAGSAAGKTVAWVGDGNNVLHSLVASASRIGFNLNIATPQGYEPDAEVLKLAFDNIGDTGITINTTNNPKEAVRGADVVVTDTWVSMGQEEDKQQRLRDFAGYQVTETLCAEANPGWVLLHCLPRKPEEVADEVFYGPRGRIVLDEAENRMWTVMAVTLALLNGKGV